MLWKSTNDLLIPSQSVRKTQYDTKFVDEMSKLISLLSTINYSWINLSSILSHVASSRKVLILVTKFLPSQPSYHHMSYINTLRLRQNGRHFPDDILKCIFLNENLWISIKISLKFVFKGPISNIPALVQIMAWRRPGDKPLSEPMMVSLLTHIYVTRPQWVKLNSCHW